MLSKILSAFGFGNRISPASTTVTSNPDHSGVLAALRDAGFFARFTPEETEVSTEQVTERGWSAIYGDNPRIYHADAEDLAECGVADFLTSCRPFLDRVGVIFTVADHCGDNEYTIALNGRQRLIWSQAEIDEDFDGAGAYTWELSAARAFEIINELLAAASSEERVYAVNGGNDLFAIFLTPRLQQLICAESGFTGYDAPYDICEGSPE